jgi:hypothetical protein
MHLQRHLLPIQNNSQHDQSPFDMADGSSQPQRLWLRIY